MRVWLLVIYLVMCPYCLSVFCPVAINMSFHYLVCNWIACVYSHTPESTWTGAKVS